jgi:hypothetical protein
LSCPSEPEGDGAALFTGSAPCVLLYATDAR